MKKTAFILATVALLFACNKPEEPNTPNTPDKPEEVDNTVHVTGISLSPASITITEEETADIVATVTPANADNKTVTWVSSDSRVASVSGSGKVTGVAAGTATITAKTEDGGKTATCEVTVEKKLAPSVTVGSQNISAVSAVLQGKANLKSAASDLKYGFRYSKSADITDGNSTKVDGANADESYNYTATISGLEPGTKYYFRSFVHQNGEDSFGDVMEFTTKAAATLIQTKDAIGISATYAEMVAGIDLTDAVYESISYGFYWGASESSQTTFVAGGQIYDDNTFKCAINDLSHRTQYWYKAYLKLDSQAFYGELKSFTTGTIPVSTVSLDKSSYSFNTIGGTITLKATVYPEDATNKAIEWSSNNTGVATVDSNGKVTAVGNGTATITVTTKDQGKTATCAITVAQVVTGVSLNAASITLNEGQTQTLTATISPSNAANKSVTWTSTNSSVAKVDANGVVTAVSKGTATITATTVDGGKTASCAVTVKRPVTSIQLNKTSLVFYRLTSELTETLTATVIPYNAENTAVTWSSSNTSVATVSNTGVVTGKSKGSATITVTAQDGNGASATCQVEVKQCITVLTVNKKKLDMIIGEQATLSTVTLLPSTANDKTYTWSTSDNTVASVDGNGNVTAKATGKATIKATANDGGGTYASCEVTVAPKPTAVDMGTVVNGKNVKWANFNIGAANQLEYGYYYSWGETDTKNDYTWGYYTFGNSTALTKYNSDSSLGTVDNKTVLDPEDDVARVKLGGSWRMPTEAEWEALRTKCTWDWKVLNGVFGQQVTATNGNKIFLPCAGYMTGTTLDLAGSYGYYWSTSLSTNSRYARAYYFLSTNWHMEDAFRSRGCSIRAVTE